MDRQLKELYRQLKEKKITPEEAAVRFKSLHVRRQQNEQRNRILAFLQKAAASVLQVPSAEIMSDVKLGEYGFDPLKLTELADLLQTEYGADLTAREIAEHETLNSLATFLLESFGPLFNAETNRLSEAVEQQSEGLTAEEGRLVRKAADYLKRLLASVLKVRAEEIAPDRDLEKYGINSIMVMKLTNELEKTFGPLPKTLFFEYKTVDELTGYFLAHYREQLERTLGASPAVSAALPEPVAPVAKERKSGRGRKWRPAFRTVPAEKTPETADIAIIGLAGRYPGARNMREFWRNLQAGKDCITEVPKERRELWQYTEEQARGIWGGFLEEVDRFDPLFFHISPREAELMDPQERLFLECVYETLEDAGYTRRALGAYKGRGMEGNVGVFVGVMYEEYQLYGAQEQLRGRKVALNGSAASIANRVSYFCNFHGPSMAVDTMCSSSLTAIHLACQHLQKGSCEVAIAGGVNVSIHPNKYIALQQGQFLSSKGRCESFGDGGDGYVPGEGVGAVLLKPLARAVADGDHIYGVIKGTALNHGGKTHGYTVPNPNAQADVIKQAFRQAGIDPRTLQYIEAHGTGTALGDPIEIAGLTKAFQEYTGDRQFCAIGSVKSNIGHAESAAGIAGLSKVLLQMKYGQLVPSLHSRVLNRHIDFASTPFVVQQELAEWKRPVVMRQGVPREAPRRAGISSFGAGGANAHIVIEEYLPPEETDREPAAAGGGPFLIVLSAQTRGQLLEQAKRLHSAIGEEGWTDRDLAALAYTLQVGREAMEERMALVVTTMEELRGKLADVVAGKQEIEGCYGGSVKSHKAALAVLAADEDMEQILEVWQRKGKYDKLLELWVKGMDIDWNRLYSGKKPGRMSLPTYPFARQRCWIPAEERKERPLTGTVLHPLLHRNTSDLYEQRFSSVFTGEEFFLSDHLVGGKRVLPGSACLEMARAAVDRAVGGWTGEGKGIRLRQVNWLRPVVAGEQPVEVHIGLIAENESEIAYEVYSETDAGEEVVHSEGTAELMTDAVPPVLDLEAVKGECSRRTLTAEEMYEAFARMGIRYGETHRGIAEVHVGEGQVLARLHLPSAAAEAGKGFHLHPGMVDAAIQAGLGLGIDSGRLEPALPFAVEEVEIYGKTGPAMWARIHQETGGKLSVDLCDETGRICLRIRGLVTREAKPDTASIEATAEEHAATTGNLLLKPVWEVIPQTTEEKFPLPGQNIVLAGGTEAEREAVARQYPGVRVLEIDDGDSIEVISGKIRQLGHVDHLIWIAPDGSVRSMTEERLIEAQEQMVIKLFRLTKAFLHLGYGQKELGWTLITTQAQQIHPDEKIQPAQSALHGFAGSLAKEYPHWPIRLIDLEKTEDIRWAFARIRHLQGEVLACRGGEWYRQQLLQVKDVQKQQVPYRTGGVYVVIGGAGGIGEVWSEYLIRNYRAKIVWIGRREKNREIADKIDRLSAYGPAPLYISADATDRRALERAHREIREKVGPVRGVVHSAIVLLDQSIEHMDEVRFRASLEAKVNVSVRLAQVFASEPLDFVLFFSSVQSFAKAAGQSNYAAGSTFEDAFALALAREWTCPVKVMNWGYWGSVGVVAAKEYHRRMAEAGIGSVEAPEAMEALEILLSNPVSQLAFINTIRPLTEQEMNPSQKISVYPATIRSYLDLLVKERPREDQRMDQVMAAIANKMEQLTSLLIKLLWSQLQSTGLFREQSGNLTRLSESLHKGYGRWLAETAAILEQHHYLKRDGQNYTLLETAPVDAEAVWREWDARRQEWIEDENIRPHLSLAEAVLRELPAILTGKKAATEILFPDSSMERVEGIYKQNAVADYYNEKLAAMVAAYLEQRKLREPGVPVRILEIGAGTGGASSAVLKKLKPFREQIKEYCYTDISRAFLLFAEKEFGSRNPNLTCKLFDVTEPVAGQGIEAGGYDIVIASNVLHATRDLRETLRNAKAALKRNGLLLLNETTSKTLLNHLTFGLLEGWWLFEDEALRIPGSPLLTAEQWQTVLRYEGFRPALAPVFPNGPQHLILAESNGVVRQRVRENHQSLLPETEISEIMPAPVASENAETDEDAVRSGITVYLKKIVGGILKLPIEQIDSAEPLERYGFDSILATQMTNALRNVFEQISGTLLFECQTLDEVADFLLKTQPETVKTLVAGSGGEKRDGAAHAQVNAAGRTPDQTDVKRTRRLRFPRRKSDRNSRMLIDVAIIGVAGRFPKANDLHEYWELLKSGQSGITEIPKKRWDWREYYDAEPGKPGHIYSKWGGFLDGIDQFDPYFFRISPAEAKRMDPQERLFLEIAYQSIADAGYTPENLSHSRRVGVFVGVMNGHYPPGASYWSIANRVSYAMNFQGPSLAVDSACSSSLTAIHLALESIYSGVSECAIAGGVNLIVHPDHYRKLSAMMMLSPGDKCRPFGKQADGIVDGEGVGAVVLKPLSQAEADGDHIYGVIKGSMLNAGGKTNGYTVPNPRQQEQVIAEALQRAGIDARTISYIEAHGTGTALGDPIEIKGLTAAFERHTSDRQFCAIGSVKSNIGHTESAAGIAGLIKVLLQLKHRQLLPSLHAGEPNVNIDFRNTPFVVQQELGEWRRPAIERDGKIREYPRRAGISSFGAGGANAHLVVEEYIPKKRKRSGSPITDNRPALIVLSAKREEALRQQANRLLAAIEREQFTSGELACIAYTLQTGREAMAERLAFTAASIAELKHQLRTFLGRADQPGDGLLRGRVKARSEGPAVSAERIRQWIRAGKFRPLLEAWVNGADVDWNQLYGTDKPSRIPLPADPFVRESFWITEHKPGVPAQVQVPSAHLHPLLHQNVSDLDGLKFATNFDGREFFLRDHVVRGKRVLPGMVSLEMALAAAMAVSSRTESGERATALRLKNVSWNRPLVLDAPTVRVHIGLFPGNNGEITYEIYKQPENGDADPTVYCQGRIVPAKAGDQTPQLDLPALRALCGKRMLTPAACYAAFQSLGIVYGPGYQGLEEIYAGQGQVLAKISLPDSVADTADQYHLHPSLLDAAVQSSLGLVSAEDRTVLFLPFALDELEIYGNCTPRMWALVRRRPKETANANLQKLDIDFCDEQGSLRLRMKGLTMKAVQSTERFQGADSGQSPLLLSPYWKAEKAVGRPDLSSAHEQRHVIVCGADENLAQEMEHRLPGVHFHFPTLRGDGIDGKFADVALEVFAVIQRILKAKPTGTVSVQVLLLNRKEYPFAGAICAMLQTARLENPRVTGQCLELEGNGGIDNILGILEENRLENRVLRVAYQDGERCVPDWREVPYAREPAAVPWKEGGVYFITGGAGGLASIFAREIARHINRGTLILAGRSQPDAARHAAFRELEKDGFRVVYRQLDVTDRDKVVRCLEDIREEYGGLDGIIHAAGVTSDQFIIQKTPSQFARVLAPKVTGLVNLDEASREDDLDFFVIFSSLAGVTGNIGQADYAAANAFADQYAQYRHHLVALDQRRGRTLSINWPLWEDGGMRIESEQEARWMQDIGMSALKSEAGIKAFYQALASGHPQVLVLHGDQNKLKRFIGAGKQQADEAERRESPPVSYEFCLSLTEKIARNELSEEQFMQLLQSQRSQIETWGKR